MSFCLLQFCEGGSTLPYRFLVGEDCIRSFSVESERFLSDGTIVWLFSFRFDVTAQTTLFSSGITLLNDALPCDVCNILFLRYIRSAIGSIVGTGLFVSSIAALFTEADVAAPLAKLVLSLCCRVLLYICPFWPIGLAV